MKYGTTRTSCLAFTLLCLPRPRSSIQEGPVHALSLKCQYASSACGARPRPVGSKFSATLRRKNDPAENVSSNSRRESTLTAILDNPNSSPKITALYGLAESLRKRVVSADLSWNSGYLTPDAFDAQVRNSASPRNYLQEDSLADFIP